MIGPLNFWELSMLGQKPSVRTPSIIRNFQRRMATRGSEEIRKAGLLTLQKNTPVHNLSFEYGISDEPITFHTAMPYNILTS